jgi:predicted kinase
MPFIPNTVYISRDEVRFSILKDGEDYFAHEDEVFEEFVRRANEAINNKEILNVIIDATHLNWPSRRKILSRLDNNWNITAVVFNTPLPICLERNEKREGRAKVPRGVVRRMFYQFTDPHNDPFPYDDIIDPYKVEVN